MGKYSARDSGRKAISDVDKSPHAIWRGIGCLMLLLMPILSIALGVETVDYGIKSKWPFPYQLMGLPGMPDWVYKIQIFRQLTLPIRQIENFYAYAAVSILYMAVISAGISVVYAIVYRMVGPARYGPFDAPPPTIKTKKYTR
jgi:hypothetical protein